MVPLEGLLIDRIVSLHQIENMEWSSIPPDNHERYDILVRITSWFSVWSFELGYKSLTIPDISCPLDLLQEIYSLSYIRLFLIDVIEIL